MRLKRNIVAAAISAGLLSAAAVHTPAFAQDQEESSISWWVPGVLVGLGLTVLLATELSDDNNDSPPVSP